MSLKEYYKLKKISEKNIFQTFSPKFGDLYVIKSLSVSGTITFHVRRKPADFYPRKRKKKPLSHFTSDTAMMNEIPMLVELNVDGSDIHSRYK